MNRGTVVALVLVGALAGCGEATGSGAEPSPPAASPTAALAASGNVRTTSTVLDPGTGPELCLGGVADSLPPQCTGPAVAGWDWADHPEHESARGVRWGEFALTGTWDGTTFTPIDVRPATESDYAEPEPLGASPCEEPAGGWQVLDPATTDDAARSALMRAAAKRADHGLVWIDDSRSLVNIGVTGDVAAAEEELRPHWGGPLCVYEVANTDARLRQVAEELRDLPGGLGGGYGSLSNTVQLAVVHDDGSIQAWVDEEYGEGVVEIASALVPVED